ncbi:uncharacterized protein [Pyrus communis]|uniref:uncharacterized protein n=1 Tax=Pyrus communis TaxID=23211 RepID=UPI0035BFB3B9
MPYAGSIAKLFQSLIIKTMTIDDLPDGLLTEILCRLPCESVTRFKSESKRWLALISDPSFVNLTRGTLFFHSKFEDERESFTIYCQREYYLCNPHTKRWVGLPPAPQWRGLVQVGFLCDAYYRYVVERITHTYDPGHFKVEIFSSKTGEWRKSVLSYSETKDYRSTSTGVGDITTDNFHFTEFGKCVDDRINNRDYSLGIIIRDYRLGVWQGRLRMCELFFSLLLYILCIWELKEEETATHGRDKWCLIESASTDQMVSEDPLIANQRVRIYEEL